jgi:hypothetical protein
MRALSGKLVEVAVRAMALRAAGLHVQNARNTTPRLGRRGSTMGNAEIRAAALEGLTDLPGIPPRSASGRGPDWHDG